MAFFHIRACTHLKNVSIRVRKPLFFPLRAPLKRRRGCFPMGKRPRGRTGAFLRQNQHFSKPEKGGAGYGSFPHRKDQRLHGHVQLPPAGQVAVPESEGAAVPHAVAAGGLGLHHEGACPHLQGRHRQHQRRDPGVGSTWLSRSGARPQRERAAWLHRVHHPGAAEGAGTDARAYPGKTYTGKSNTGKANVGCPYSGEPRPIKY